MKNRNLCVLALLVFVFALGSILLASEGGGDHNCREFAAPCSDDAFGCEASSWQGWPGCYLQCKVEGKHDCPKIGG